METGTFREASSEATRLMRELNSLNSQKEQAYAVYKAARTEGISLIEKVKTLKKERNDFTDAVKALKERRKALSSEATALIEQAKQKRKALEAAEKKTPGKSLTAARKQIEKIELKLETEPVPFEQEKKISEKLKQLKKELQGLEILSALSQEVKKISAEINRLRKETETVHSEIQEKAGLSQERHEEMIKVSGEIKARRETAKEAWLRFSEFKEKFSDMNTALENKLMDVGKLKEALEKKKLVERMSRVAREERRIEDKERELEAKMRSGKKLTTDDLLALQRAS